RYQMYLHNDSGNIKPSTLQRAYLNLRGSDRTYRAVRQTPFDGMHLRGLSGIISCVDEQVDIERGIFDGGASHLWIETGDLSEQQFDRYSFYMSRKLKTEAAIRKWDIVRLSLHGHVISGKSVWICDRIEKMS